ncbi:ABC transporter permease [Proteiniclasticum sp. C24MP]|uniref:ABC transporter permease n=1 Tax=Proteiniclasticum sp. C24MP TaxID=3374101 RepID=UPI003754EA46
MQVFKVSMKVLKRNYPSILIYLGIFLGLSLLFASQGSRQEEEYTSFETVKTPVAVFAEEDTPLVRGFVKNLSETAEIVELKDEEDTISDALYFRIVTYVIRIPEGFTQSFMRSQEMILEKETISGTFGNTYTDLAVNSFFSTAALYLAADETLSEEALVDKTVSALKERTPVEVKSQNQKEEDGYAKFYFNYMSYSLVSILVLGTSLIMLVWKDKDLYARTEVSPLKRSSISLQKYLALGIFTLLTWSVLNGAYFLVNPRSTPDLPTLLHMGNSLVFSFTAMGMSFLIGTLLKSRNAISAVSNVVSLGPSFISGVFVPQELLGSSVLSMAKVTPTYWYVTANNRISSLGSLQEAQDHSVFTFMLIVFAFGMLFFILSALAGRKAMHP